MKLMTIASGSSGNSCFVGNDDTTILVDVGITMKAIENGLNTIDLTCKDVDAIVITHEHIDHVKALGVISRKHNIPIYATYGTIDGLMTMKSLGVFDYNLLRPIKNNSIFNVGSITVNTQSISHDTNDPVCYSFEADKKKVAIATDLGKYDNMIIDFLSECDAMVIEANHDIRMLEANPVYPYVLKKRILGDRGHLCNEASGRLIREVLNDHIKYVALGHLSDKNNYPELAFEAVKHELSDNPFSSDVRDFGLCVARRSEPGDLITV